MVTRTQGNVCLSETVSSNTGKNYYGPGRKVVRLTSQKRSGCVRYSEKMGFKIDKGHLFPLLSDFPIPDLFPVPQTPVRA
jgi:hypothetical protein